MYVGDSPGSVNLLVSEEMISLPPEIVSELFPSFLPPCICQSLLSQRCLHGRHPSRSWGSVKKNKAKLTCALRLPAVQWERRTWDKAALMPRASILSGGGHLLWRCGAPAQRCQSGSAARSKFCLYRDPGASGHPQVEERGRGFSAEGTAHRGLEGR